METVAPYTEPKPDLFLVTNGYSFNAEAMKPKLDALTASEKWGEVTSIPTTIDNTYLEELLPRITTGSTVVISGGDDTVRRTLLGLQKKGFTGEEIDIVVAGAGGENVVAQTLHGKEHSNDPLAILQSGKKRTIYHTEASMLDEDGKPFRTEEFIFGLGIGTSARAMRKYFNDSEWRERQHRRSAAGQWLAKRGYALAAVITSPRIKTSRGKAIDVTISGGEYSGGRAMHYDTSLSNSRENMLSVTKRWYGLLSIIGRNLRTGIAPGDTWHGGHGTIRIDSKAEAEVDGNNIEAIPAGTTIRFQRAAQGIAVLAMR